MKRNGDIVSLFQKHAAKKAAAAATVSSPPAATAATMVEGEPQVQETIIEEIENSRPSSPPQVLSPPPPPPPPPPQVYDINRLPHDLGERLPIQSYSVNDQDAIRRAYILKCPFKPYAHKFPKRKLEKDITASILCGFIIMIGLNIVSRRILRFALYATCSRRAMGQIHLLQMIGEIGI